MADINQVQLPDGSQYNIKDSNSGYATETYVQNQISAIDKTTVGLGNVDNTSDANKPVSTVQQTALDGKVNTSMVAHVQTTLTADMRYVVGDEFIYQGNLYKATAIIPNGDAIVINTNAVLADDISTQIGNANTAIGTLNTTVAGKAGKSDLASISETGSTASQAISAGTYFYLDGVLVKALTAISSGAAFTENTNYEAVTAGGLNDVSSLVSGKVDSSRFVWTSSKAMVSGTNFCNYPSGFAYNNCCVIGGRVNTETGVYRQGLSWASGLNALSANIQFSNGDTSLNGKNWQLLLYKY